MRHLRSPIEVGLEVTWQCNLNCQHCLVRTNTRSQFAEISTERLKEAISELADLDVIRIFLTGGEPLLREDTSELIKFGYHEDIEMVLTTNGTLLSDHLESLREYVQGIQISIDGHSPHTHDRIRGGEGSFQKAIDAAELVARTGIPLSIHAVACKSNLSEIRRIYEVATSVGASKFTISDLQPAGGALGIYDKEALSKKEWDFLINHFNSKDKNEIRVNIEGFRFSFLYDQVRWEPNTPYELFETSCSCGKTKCFISPNGDVLPCPLLRDVSAGNLLESSFAELWEKSVLINDLRRRMEYGPKECVDRRCRYLSLCQGGCAAHAEIFLGDMMKADPRCPIIRGGLGV